MKKWPITSTVIAFGLSVICVIAGFKAGTKEPVCLSVPHVDRVYDGDTFYVTFPDWPPIVGENIGIRINGIDTPELRTKSDKEKQLAIQAKAFVESRLLKAKHIELLNVQRGKYFRLVADVIVDCNDLAEDLINAGLAVPYDGGTKTKDWSE